MVDLPNKIRQVRKNLKLSQKAFAKKLERSFATVQRLEYGKQDPSLDILRKIAELGGVSLDWLLAERGGLNEPYGKAKDVCLKVAAPQAQYQVDDLQELIGGYLKLPPPGRQQIRDMIEFLLSKAEKAESPAKKATAA